MTYRIRRVSPHQTAKLAAVAYAALSLLMVPFLAAVSLFAPSEEGFGMAAIIALPVVYGGLGYVATALAAILYNFLASKLGGIELTLESNLVEADSSLGKVFE